MLSSQRKNLHVRTNDLVSVISGKAKGKSGKVIRVSAKTGRVTIEGLNLVKRHMKPSSSNPQGGVIEKELPIHASNVLVLCSKCGRGTRHGVRSEVKEGSKIRVCKRCGSSPDKS